MCLTFQSRFRILAWIFPEDRTASKPSMVGGFLEASIICKAVQCSQIAGHVDREGLNGRNAIDPVYRNADSKRQLTEANTTPMTHDGSIKKQRGDSADITVPRACVTVDFAKVERPVCHVA